MAETNLSDLYRDYIDCLNKQDWPKLGQFVDDDVHNNGQVLGCQVIARCWREIFGKFRIFISTSN